MVLLISIAVLVLVLAAFFLITKGNQNKEESDFGPQGVLGEIEYDLIARISKFLTSGNKGLLTVNYNAILKSMEDKYHLSYLTDYILATLPESTEVQIFATSPEGQSIVGGKVYSISAFHHEQGRLIATYG